MKLTPVFDSMKKPRALKSSKNFKNNEKLFRLEDLRRNLAAVNPPEEKAWNDSRP